MFTEFGFYKEFYVDSRFIGNIECEKDREVYGHFGRKTETLERDIVTINKRKIKKGTIVTTMLFPYCGTKSNTK
jgi:hypothetical protein